MGGSKGKHEVVSNGNLVQADLLQMQRDCRQQLLPSDISKIKERIYHLLRSSIKLVSELSSHLCCLAPSNPYCASSAYAHLAPEPRGNRVLRLQLRSLFGCFDTLCNHTAQSLERPSISSNGSLQNDVEGLELLKQKVRDLEEMVGTKSQEMHRLAQQREFEAAAWLKEKEMLVQNYEGDLARSSERVKGYEEQCKVLQGKLEKAETLQAQRSLVDSGSYEDCTATPPLLQAAADAVKDAIAMCASDVFSTTKKHSISLRASELGFKNGQHAGAYITKVAFQALLCQVFFKGFEDPFSFTDCTSLLPPFEKPENRRQCMLQSYKKLRYSNPQQMFCHVAEFKHFLIARLPAFCDRLRCVLFKNELEPNQLREFIRFEFLNKPGSSVQTSLLRLVKAVWLLQKIAFAMEPNAQIFRVGQSSEFEEDFMEDIAPVDEFEFDDVDDDCKTLTGANHTKKVNFMCVPGFTVRQTIIKARVVCIKD